MVWQTVSATGIVDPSVLPAPSHVAGQGIGQWDVLIRHTAPTLAATVLGFILSITVAFVVASALDFSGTLRGAILPLLIVGQTLPLIALAPLVVLWFGFGLLPKVLLVAFVTFFPMVVGLMRGFASADSDAQYLLRSMGRGACGCSAQSVCLRPCRPSSRRCASRSPTRWSARCSRSTRGRIRARRVHAVGEERLPHRPRAGRRGRELGPHPPALSARRPDRARGAALAPDRRGERT